MADPVEILDFWLGEVGHDGWFNGGDAVDDAIRTRFLDVWQAARDGGLDHWVDGTVGTLAYLIVTDQFSRNMFRGSPDAFATDALALAAARRAVDQGWDMNAPEPERNFFYLPFEHSEALEDQKLSVELVTERLSNHPDLAFHARAHFEVIRRFGRFPYRNAAFGRTNTPEETAFLQEGSYPGLIRRMREAEKG